MILKKYSNYKLYKIKVVSTLLHHPHDSLLVQRRHAHLGDRVDADQIVDDWRIVVGDIMEPTAVGVWVRS